MWWGLPHDQLEWEVQEVDMIIESDASVTGWGATGQNQRTGSPQPQGADDRPNGRYSN